MKFNKLATGLLTMMFVVPSLAKADERLSLSKHLSTLNISGDIRLRQENFWKSSAGQTDRSRQRFRFRLGIKPTIEDITIGFRLASGTGEQTSTNQSFDNAANQKGIYIDQAYVSWKALEWATLSGGRMENPFWMTAASDIMWDTDVNPEGFAQQFNFKALDNLDVFFNAAQLVLDEDSTDTFDQWMFGAQLGSKVEVYKDSKFKIAGTLYYFLNETKSNLSQGSNENNSVALEGNSRTPAGVLTATFTVVHLTSEIQTKVLGQPLKIQADYLKNVAANGSLGAISKEQAAYQVGAILGKASSAMSWETAYFFKWAETNSTIADLTDADWGDGGTNRRGHIMWIAFSPRDYIQLKAKLFVTEVIRNEFAPGRDNINRMQLDMVIKF